MQMDKSAVSPKQAYIKALFRETDAVFIHFNETTVMIHWEPKLLSSKNLNLINFVLGHGQRNLAKSEYTLSLNYSHLNVI